MDFYPPFDKWGLSVDQVRSVQYLFTPLLKVVKLDTMDALRLCRVTRRAVLPTEKKKKKKRIEKIMAFIKKHKMACMFNVNCLSEHM